MNKKIAAVTLFMTLATFCWSVEQESHFIQAQKSEKTKLALVICGQLEKDLEECAHSIKRDLEFTDQFQVTQDIATHTFTHTNDFKKYKQYGPFLIVLNGFKDEKNLKNSLQWRLYKYDKAGNSVFLKGLELQDDAKKPWTAHTIAHDLYKELTGLDSPFLSKLAYCKKRPQDKEGNCLCISDYDGKNEKIILPSSMPSTITYMSPTWGVGKQHPQLLYSEYTPVNLRLMMTDFIKEPAILTDFDGINMLPAFSADGRNAYVCLSVEGKTNIYQYVKRRFSKGGDYVRLTMNDGINISPTILSDGSIAFCSDHKLGIPHIYIMDKKGKNVRRISESQAHLYGMATSCCYSHANNKIAYVQQIKGILQIMTYDVNTQTREQISFDNKDKANPSWSPCGNYIVCSAQDTVGKKLVCYNLLTKTHKTLKMSFGESPETKDKVTYSYPAWSPFFESFNF